MYVLVDDRNNKTMTKRQSNWKREYKERVGCFEGILHARFVRHSTPGDRTKIYAVLLCKLTDVPKAWTWPLREEVAEDDGKIDVNGL